MVSRTHLSSRCFAPAVRAAQARIECQARIGAGQAREPKLASNGWNCRPGRKKKVCALSSYVNRRAIVKESFPLVLRVLCGIRNEIGSANLPSFSNLAPCVEPESAGRFGLALIEQARWEDLLQYALQGQRSSGCPVRGFWPATLHPMQPARNGSSF